ncbi:Pex19 protein family-domain-containing protein, partial [Talaromyces proteolyticus]
MSSTEQTSEITDKTDEQLSPPAPSQGGENTAAQVTPAKAQYDDDSDWEDLDDVLDDFNQPKQSKATTKDAATAATSAANDALPDIPSNLPNMEDLDQEAFMKLLESDMLAKLTSEASIESPSSQEPRKAAEETEIPAENTAFEKLFKEIEDSGVNFEQLLGGLLAESVKTNQKSTEATEQTGSSRSETREGAAAGASGDVAGEKASFQDTIQQTLNRMQESGDKATAATAEDGDSDMINQLFKTLQQGGGLGEGEDMDIDKIFSTMMEQLSNKEMLYQPMTELNDKYGPWLEENKSKVTAEELETYETQARLVSEIVAKFNESDYSDSKPECRKYIWDRMQAMQAAGSPPEDLISNPLND